MTETELKPEEMDFKLYLITDKMCLGCQQAKAALEDQIKQGIIKEIDFNSKKGKELVTTLKIETLPALVIEKNGRLALCDLKMEGDDVVIDCPDLDSLQEMTQDEFESLAKGKGQVVISCMDPVVKAQLATMLMDKTDDVTRQILFALPPCEDGKIIGFEKIQTKRKKKNVSEYVEFMRKCLKEIKAESQAEKMKICALKWKEEKEKRKKEG